jgi:hypothetical protein
MARSVIARVVMSRRRVVAAAFLAALLGAFGSEAASAQESTHYAIDGLTVGSGATIAAGARFDMSVTVAEIEPAGASSFCNLGFGVTLGTASFLGELAVPSYLSVTLDRGNPAYVDLAWSGSAQKFDVYRGTSASTLVTPGNYYTTAPGCLVIDTTPFVGKIIYYTVIPVEN